MIDVQSLYESLDHDLKTRRSKWRARSRGYLSGEPYIASDLAASIIEEAEMQTAIETPQNPYTFDYPRVMIKGCRFDGDADDEDKEFTHVILAVYGQVSDKKYRRTISLDDGMLDEEEFVDKAQALHNQIEDAEHEARLEKSDNEQLFNDLYSLLSSAFGEDNVDSTFNSSSPIQLQVKKDGSVRLNMNDLDAASALKLAEFVAESDLDLDL